MKRDYQNEARQVAEAIVEMVEHPDALSNFELYLSHNFGEWLRKFASDPESMAAELREFASIHE